jgi:hypothetical protein
MDPITLGLDLGRSETRLYDGEHLTVFPSLVGGPVATVRRGNARLVDEVLDQHLSIKLDRHTYTIGRHALEQPFLFPVNDLDLFAEDLNLALLLSMLGLYARRHGLGGIPRFKLCLGLPVALAKRVAYVEQQVRAWTRLHTFEFCGEPMSLDLVQIDVIPQPVGAVYAAILGGQLEYSPTEIIGVIDPGHLSTDWVVVRLPNELAAYSGQTTAAAGFRLTEAVTDHLAAEGVSRINPIGVMEALSSGEYRDNGAAIPVPSEITAELVELMAQQIALTVRQSWRDLSIDRMLLVGGFGRILYPHLTQYPYFRDLQLASDFRYYNVRGAYEYAVATPQCDQDETPTPARSRGAKVKVEASVPPVEVEV